MSLSVGMNYLFHQPRREQLIMEAYNDFERRMMWRIHFTLTQENSDFYDPDYEVEHEVSSKRPQIPAYMHVGLKLGRLFVAKTIAKIQSEKEVALYHTPLTPSVSQVRHYLANRDYLITPTDKNLGLAVSKRGWLIEKCNELLASQSDYKPLSEIEARAKLQYKNKLMSDLADIVPEHLPECKQLRNFLRSKITSSVSDQAVPQFYGIPKIHKEPVKMRPIIPCHSATQNPAAKFVSKKLKPLIKAAPTILHGTKDLAIKLSKISIDRRRKWFIVTGDVVAFYPNIDLQRCLDIIKELYVEHYVSEELQNVADVTSTPLGQQQLLEFTLFCKALEVGNTDLVCQFDKKFYLQLRGLAMGVADSPDLANLYGWFFEERCRIQQHPSVAFYGRYIDDCVAIVYAESEREACSLLERNVKFDNCTIEWSASAYAQPFLDMTLYRDSDGSLQHMPFRKARSHSERIPWISHHPLDVKRGTFIGEMSRLATLCSTFDNYKSALQGLVNLYEKRGYPHNVLSSWLKNNIAERWNNRLRESSREGAEVLVLKSEYNTAWNYFNASELGDTILGYWREWITRAESGNYGSGFEWLGVDVDPATGPWLGEFNTRVVIPGGGENGRTLTVSVPDIRKMNILHRRMIVSRKRTRNLFDISTLWKKEVLRKLDERILDNPSVPIISERALEESISSGLVEYKSDSDEGDSKPPSIVDMDTDDSDINIHRRCQLRSLFR